MSSHYSRYKGANAERAVAKVLQANSYAVAEIAKGGAA
jgi:hypothetical protein